MVSTTHIVTTTAAMVDTPRITFHESSWKSRKPMLCMNSSNPEMAPSRDATNHAAQKPSTIAASTPR